MNDMIRLILFTAIVLSSCSKKEEVSPLGAGQFDHYFDKFNENDQELYVQYIPNDSAKTFLLDNIPVIHIPDKEIEETYYFRWWTFRKHIKKTEDGYVITEFLPEVSWSGEHNTISCPAGHHIYEGRWLKNPEYVQDYIDFWLTKAGKNTRRYSFWLADAALAFYMLHRNDSLIKEQLPDFINNFKEWEEIRKDADKTLFWQFDAWDGMEFSASGRILNEGEPAFKVPAVRTSINSYMYGDAKAIASMAELVNSPKQNNVYSKYADSLKKTIQLRLWNEDLNFFTVLPKVYSDTTRPLNVRENIGYTPWYFNLPDDTPEYALAWKKVLDTTGFYAPYGLTTCERSHPFFEISYVGADCQWNGPSWPFATSITLKALSNFLNNYSNNAQIDKEDFYSLLEQYAQAHYRKTETGKTVNWIDENINPFTGDWISRTRLKTWKNGTWSDKKGGVERGKDYNHSSFCDLVISDLLGVKPSIEGRLRVQPLVPETWEWFCIDNVWYQGKKITLIWDRYGKKFSSGAGLTLYVNGKLVMKKEKIESFEIDINQTL